jgi:hypothetical protein
VKLPRGTDRGTRDLALVVDRVRRAVRTPERAEVDRLPLMPQDGSRALGDQSAEANDIAPLIDVASEAEGMTGERAQIDPVPIAPERGMLKTTRGDAARARDFPAFVDGPCLAEIFARRNAEIDDAQLRDKRRDQQCYGRCQNRSKRLSSRNGRCSHCPALPGVVFSVGIDVARAAATNRAILRLLVRHYTVSGSRLPDAQRPAAPSRVDVVYDGHAWRTECPSSQVERDAGEAR